MSAQLAPENVCYVHCNYCNTILAVSVPGNNMFNIVTGNQMESGSSSKSNRASASNSTESDQQQMLPIRPPEKRQRVPSAYNRFIKEEIQRIKSMNPDISHREAFSAAAKNWAHFPHIHFGLTLDANKQAKIDEPISAQGSQKSQEFY